MVSPTLETEFCAVHCNSKDETNKSKVLQQNESDLTENFKVLVTNAKDGVNNLETNHNIEMQNVNQKIDVWNNDAKGTKQMLKWQQHAGGNRFFCNGRIIMSKQCSIFLLTVFLIVLTMSLFCVFDLPYLTDRVSIALPFVAAILFLLVMTSLFKTSFSDPGILPRASIREVIEWDRQLNNTTANFNNSEWTPPRTKIVQIHGQNIKLKYCFTCCIFRPPRSSHCSICDNCILNFDHHCPWVGNCVGLRNYRYFYFFISFLSILDLFIGACVVIHLIMLSNEKGTFFDAMKESPASIFTAFINFISIWSIIGLSGFHTYLISINQTTNEDIKGTFSPKIRPSIRNPYNSHSFIKNIFETLCGPERPSLVNRRGVVKNSEVVTIDLDVLKSWAIKNQPIFKFPSGENFVLGRESTTINDSSFYRHKSHLVVNKCQNNNDRLNENRACQYAASNTLTTRNSAVHCVSTTAAGCGASVAPVNQNVTLDDESDEDTIESRKNIRR